jgi:hypothetical protein
VLRAWIVILWSTLAQAEPVARHPEVAAVNAVMAARSECRHPGPGLTALVAEVFDPARFGKDVLGGWHELTDEQRRAFEKLADRLIGTVQRADATRLLCTKGARIVRAWRQSSGLVLMDLELPEIDDCSQLMFREDGNRWRYAGELYCGYDPFLGDWHKRLGDSYDSAMAYLTQAAAARP